MVLLLASFAAAADTVKLTYDAGTPPAAMRCVGDRERQIGETTMRSHLELRSTSVVEKQGKAWAIRTGAIDVIAATSEPAPPAGAPNLESLLPKVETLMPAMLLDKKGNWLGVEQRDPAAQDTALTTFLQAAGLPEGFITAVKPMLLASIGPDAIAARQRESWYAGTGHWLGRTLEIGRSEIGVAAEGDPLGAGTQMTWSATRRVPCTPPAAGAAPGPATCVELRLEAKPQAAGLVAEAGQLVSGVARAVGLPPDQVRYESAAVSTTWVQVVDPATLSARSYERRKVVDVQMIVGEQKAAAHTLDVFTCVAE